MSDYGATPDAPWIVKEDRPDPDRPDRGRTPHTVRGARRYDGILAMFGPKSSEYLAAERYRDDTAIASGARIGAQAVISRSGHPTSGGPSDAVLDALQRVGDAWHAMGSDVAAVVIWVVLGNGSLATYEAEYTVRHGAGGKLLRTAMARLVAHYEEVDGG